MKRHFVFVFLLATLAFTSCENIQKSHNHFDEGIKLMMIYSRNADAIKEFNQAIKYDKHSFEAFYYRGCAKYNMKDYKNAILDFEKAVELKPDYADAYFNLGKTYFCINDYDMMCYYYKLAQQYGRENMDNLLESCP